MKFLISASLLAISFWTFSSYAVVVRKDQANMSKSEKALFKKAYLALAENGTLSEFVKIHAKMKEYKMHSLMLYPNGKIKWFPKNIERFLPWHRALLSVFERELQKIEPDVTIPYWDWLKDREIPKWLLELKPTGVLTAPQKDCCDFCTVREPIVINRFPGTHPLAHHKVSRANTLRIVNSTWGYKRFTKHLEGHPFGPHNHIHLWVGGKKKGRVGTMADVTKAPADPIFWLHHSMIDRLWAIWQKNPANVNKKPNLREAEAVMAPFSKNGDEQSGFHTSESSNDIEDLGYTYDNFKTKSWK
ncbi:MAG: tyrosinase family protein [Bacteriovoracaceae bacterium]|jgi:tyrosinase|nr:tyrosinase family protein [Bacteriovoracaceae bacterium]